MEFAGLSNLMPVVGNIGLEDFTVRSRDFWSRFAGCKGKKIWFR